MNNLDQPKTEISFQVRGGLHNNQNISITATASLTGGVQHYHQ